MTNILQCPACGYVQEKKKGNIHSTSKVGGEHNYYICKNPSCGYKKQYGVPVAIFVDYDQDMPYKTAKGKTYMIYASSKNPAKGEKIEELEDMTDKKQGLFQKAGAGGLFPFLGKNQQQQFPSQFSFLQQKEQRKTRQQPLLDTFFNILSVRKGGKASPILLECKKCKTVISDRNNNKKLKKAWKHVRECY